MTERDDIKSLLNATDVFERIYLINKQLNPPDDAGIRNYTPGIWPTMGELRKLTELAEELRKHYKLRRK